MQLHVISVDEFQGLCWLKDVNAQIAFPLFSNIFLHSIYLFYFALLLYFSQSSFFYVYLRCIHVNVKVLNKKPLTYRDTTAAYPWFNDMKWLMSCQSPW